MYFSLHIVACVLYLFVAPWNKLSELQFDSNPHWPVLSIYHLRFLSWRQSASQEEGYDKVAWTSDVETHPPWLRFHLGISRWELYNRKDPNLALMTHYLATQRILGAGE